MCRGPGTRRSGRYVAWEPGMGRWALLLLLALAARGDTASGTVTPVPATPVASAPPTGIAIPAPGSTAPAGPTTCPPGFPIKAVGGTYVLPGSASYDSANPVARCFATEE